MLRNSTKEKEPDRQQSDRNRTPTPKKRNVAWTALQDRLTNGKKLTYILVTRALSKPLCYDIIPLSFKLTVRIRVDCLKLNYGQLWVQLSLPNIFCFSRDDVKSLLELDYVFTLAFSGWERQVLCRSQTSNHVLEILPKSGQGWISCQRQISANVCFSQRNW